MIITGWRLNGIQMLSGKDVTCSFKKKFGLGNSSHWIEYKCCMTADKNFISKIGTDENCSYKLVLDDETLECLGFFAE